MGVSDRSALWEGVAEVHCGRKLQKCIVGGSGRSALWEEVTEVHCGRKWQTPWCMAVSRVLINNMFSFVSSRSWLTKTSCKLE